MQQPPVQLPWRELRGNIQEGGASGSSVAGALTASCFLFAKVAMVVKRSNSELSYVAPWVAKAREKAADKRARQGGKVLSRPPPPHQAASFLMCRANRFVSDSAPCFSRHIPLVRLHAAACTASRIGGPAGKMAQGIIANLDRERFEVVIFALREPWVRAHGVSVAAHTLLKQFAQFQPNNNDVVYRRIRERADRWHDMPKTELRALTCVRLPIFRSFTVLLSFLPQNVNAAK